MGSVGCTSLLYPVFSANHENLVVDFSYGPKGPSLAVEALFSVGEVDHSKRDARYSPDKIENRRVGFEAHAFRAEIALQLTDEREFQVFTSESLRASVR